MERGVSNLGAETGCLRRSRPRLGPPGLLIWVAVTACADSAEESSPPDPGLADEQSVFIQPFRECRPAVAGDDSGSEICTWNAIAGATAEGHRFSDFAECGVVLTQRPYYPVPAYDGLDDDELRMEDPDYVRELDWVREQVNATGCACCHSSDAPDGPSRWSSDASGNWVRTMNDRDVALLADWLGTEMFGRFPPEDNNGFVRDGGIPSTDPERALRFFEEELAYRGRVPEDFDGQPPTGLPLVEQATFVPEPCGADEGVGRDGLVRWSGGPARYIYVMDEGSDNPTVPPNLDLPEGTLWRLDVPHTGVPLHSGAVEFGNPPDGLTQRFPTQGRPSELVPGRSYYLYVTQDVFRPITRCVFEY